MRIMIIITIKEHKTLTINMIGIRIRIIMRIRTVRIRLTMITSKQKHR